MAKRPSTSRRISGAKQLTGKKAAGSDRTRRRIQDVPTLYSILPTRSAASGKEFARLVNLLLFHDGRKNGRTVTLFDDRAGDVRGLDAYEEQNGLVGYQHKFFPSPLSSSHRSQIKQSLTHTREKEKKSKSRKSRLKKWILVTPEDFVESSKRKDSGDVSWFEGLREELDLPFDTEHWGHTQLQALLLQTPSIGLYYYPELFPDGSNRRKSIAAIRKQYDAAMQKEHGYIEFVGMSVYKQEAARTVPMEHIYIPLAVVPNDGDDEDPNLARRDPLEFLEPGSHTVVLGDPGSGKTTLLKFLALFGQSAPLQRRTFKSEKRRRFKFERDDRLTVFITLRRYADALKADDNLSLIEYIRRNTEADLSIAGVTTEYLEYYLESGKAILLFDGLDELSSPAFKGKIRNRIQNLTAAYPGNTAVVTSRIYGYQGPFHFNDRDFAHHRLAKLRDEEITQFVCEWYDARLERPQERKEYLESLLTILRNEQHVAIRDLARNPLLLTIMVLVHRIDAVLPDERHVLYHKCTETLLTTWHTWKFHEMDQLHRAKVDQQNMQRMQAIACWMHHEMGSEERGRQAVVTYKALHACLAEHIATETPPNPEYAPGEIATAFLEFVQDRAGLLIEIGDRQFSFIHLTFQEYLTAARIKTLAELHGVTQAWAGEIKDHCSDPRWREVIRLLIAGYAQDAQQFLFERVLESSDGNVNVAQLLGGLLLDGVPSAVMRQKDVIQALLMAACGTSDREALRNTLSTLRACLNKDEKASDTLKAAVSQLNHPKAQSKETALRLTLLSSGMAPDDVWQLCGTGSERERALISLFSGQSLTSSDSNALHEDLESFWAELDTWVLLSPNRNFVASALQSLDSWDPLVAARTSLARFLTVVTLDVRSGPFRDFVVNTILFTTGYPALHLGTAISIWVPALDPAWALDLVRARALDQALVLDLDRALDRARAPALARPRIRARALDLDRARIRVRALDLDRAPAFAIRQHFPYDASIAWEMLAADPQITGAITESLCSLFDLRPALLWNETLAVLFLPTVPGRIHLVDAQCWRQTLNAFETDELGEADIYAAAWQLVFDGALYTLGWYDVNTGKVQKALNLTTGQFAQYRTAIEETQSLFRQLAALTCSRDDIPLRVAHCLRDICYGTDRSDDLKAMVESDDPRYRAFFERCHWDPIEGQLKRKKPPAGRNRKFKRRK